MKLLSISSPPKQGGLRANKMMHCRVTSSTSQILHIIPHQHANIAACGAGVALGAHTYYTLDFGFVKSYRHTCEECLRRIYG